MNVKEAVVIARNEIKELFASEHPENIGLEEARFYSVGDEGDFENAWKITIGFSRPWKHSEGGLQASLSAISMLTSLESHQAAREYKIVWIDDASREVKALNIREMQQ